MKGLARLEDMPVVTEDGTRLGRIFELRSPGRAETEPTYTERPVEYLLCGERGWLERLGWIQRRPRMIPWSAALDMRDGALLVRDACDEDTTREST